MGTFSTFKEDCSNLSNLKEYFTLTPLKEYNYDAGILDLASLHLYPNTWGSWGIFFVNGCPESESSHIREYYNAPERLLFCA